MVRPLHPTMFHRIVQFYFGKKKQLEKIIEEVKELEDAVDSGDREEIIKELADVETVLPYLKLSFLYDSNLKIERMHDKPDFKFFSLLVYVLLREKFYTEDSILLKKITAIAVTGYCNALYGLYLEYDIDPKEVDAVIDYKKRRTMKRIIGGYYK